MSQILEATSGGYSWTYLPGLTTRLDMVVQNSLHLQLSQGAVVCRLVVMLCLDWQTLPLDMVGGALREAPPGCQVKTRQWGTSGPQKDRACTVRLPLPSYKPETQKVPHPRP